MDLLGDLTTFLGLFHDIWGATFLGMDMTQILAGALIMLGFLFLRKLFAKFVIFKLKLLTKKTETDFDDKVLEALEGPLKFIPIIAGIFFFAQYFALPADAYIFFMTLTKSLIAATLFWGLYNIITPFKVILEKFLAKLTAESETIYAEEFTGIIVIGFKIVFAVVGVVVVLSQWGVNVMPLLGGLGIAGMALALAAQDTVANIFGGIKILLDGQFKRGDWIQVGDTHGTVAEIGIATTKIREFDKAMTSFPNKDLANSQIKNWSRMTNRRIKMTIGVEYRTTAAQLHNIVARIRKYIEEDPDVAQPNEYPCAQMVHLTEFADSSININLYYFTKTTSWAKWRQIRHDHMLTFKQFIEEENAGFAFPSMSLYHENEPGKSLPEREEKEVIKETVKDWADESQGEEGSG